MTPQELVDKRNKLMNRLGEYVMNFEHDITMEKFGVRGGFNTGQHYLSVGPYGGETSRSWAVFVGSDDGTVKRWCECDVDTKLRTVVHIPNLRIATIEHLAAQVRAAEDAVSKLFPEKL